MPKRSKILKVDESICLHLPEKGMAQELFNLINEQRDYLSKWLIWVEQTKSVKDSLTFLKEAGIFNRGGQRLSTLIKYNEKIVGCMGFVKIDKVNKKGEIGYWISENMQGKGIITKACEKLIEYAFKHLELNRIVIKTDTQNAKSKAIPLRMGFTFEGTLRQDISRKDHFRNTDLYSLLKKEWLERKAVR
jgi:ribosomal-protein-serine acetyltransferase